MPEPCLQLTLEAGQSLPIHLCWRLNGGYVRAIGQTDLAETYTLGMWGPGEIVMPQFLSLQHLELRALSRVQVQEWSLSPDEQQHWSRAQIMQMGMLLQFTRVRPVEVRLFHLLIWLSERFGSSSPMPRTRDHLAPVTAPLRCPHRQAGGPDPRSAAAGDAGGGVARFPRFVRSRHLAVRGLRWCGFHRRRTHCRPMEVCSSRVNVLVSLSSQDVMFQA
jgi:hypothetical protein